MKKNIGWLRKLLVFALTLGIAGTAAAQLKETADQILRKYNKLPANEREKALIKGAQAEGELAFNTAMKADELTQLTKAFNKRYPFLKLNVSRLGGRRVVTRIETEYRAGKYQVDLAAGMANISYSLKSAGLIAPYYSPQRKFFPVRDSEKEGYFAPDYIAPIVLGYNTTMVKRAEVPKTYEELLLPKWKGKMFLDDEDYDWFMALLKHFGRDEGIKYMKKLAAQNVGIRRGRALQAQLIVAGERPIGIALHANSLLDFRSKGAPIDFTIIDPYVAKPSEIMLLRNAPHPHAAALYIDWVLSEAGQTMQASFGRIVARKGIKVEYPELVERKYFLAGAEEIGPDLPGAIKEFNAIFGAGH